MKKNIPVGLRTGLEVTGFLRKTTLVVRLTPWSALRRIGQIRLVRSAADSGCCGKVPEASQGNLWPSHHGWALHGFSWLEGRRRAEVVGEETEPRTIDLNLNTIQKKTINSRRKNTGVIYLGGSENIKFFQVTSGGVVEEVYWKHTEKTAVCSQWVLQHAEVLDICYITHFMNH